LKGFLSLYGICLSFLFLKWFGFGRCEGAAGLWNGLDWEGSCEGCWFMESGRGSFLPDFARRSIYSVPFRIDVDGWSELVVGSCLFFNENVMRNFFCFPFASRCLHRTCHLLSRY
jgi:hypothetical protein